MERLRDEFGRLWFWFSQTAAILALVNIIDDARVWAETIRWLISKSPPILSDGLKLFAEAINLGAWPMRFMADWLFGLLGVDWPAWMFSLLTLALLYLTGVIRRHVLTAQTKAAWGKADKKNNELGRTRAEGVERSDLVFNRYGIWRKSDLKRIEIFKWRATVNKYVTNIIIILAMVLLIADFMLWLTE